MGPLVARWNDAFRDPVNVSLRRPEQLPSDHVAELIRRNDIESLQDLTNEERVALASHVQRYGHMAYGRVPNPPPVPAPAVGRPFRVTDDNRYDAESIEETLIDAMNDGQASVRDRIAVFERHINALAQGVEALEDIVPQPLEEWINPEGLRFELMRRMQINIEYWRRSLQLDDDDAPQQFAKGGRVTHAPTIDDMRYELMMRRV